MTANTRKTALEFILLFGIISAFGDITYEGARSIYGAYLGHLGATASVIGIVTGLGEFLGYALRLASGYFIDHTKRYWAVTILGYALLAAVPLLAIAGRWQEAAVFVILERIGKAIRSPGKDTMISHATKQLGTGFGFGLHEALDQIGGVAGPLVFTMTLASSGGYEQGLTLMWVPATLTVAIALIARSRFPRPELLEENPRGDEPMDKPPAPLPRVFLIYAAFIFVSVLGFANFPIISYHLECQHIVSESAIPTLYAAAMAVDAVVAPIVGRLYDKNGIILIASIPMLTMLIALFSFFTSPVLVVLSIVLWGAVMGIHETVMRATIADITTIDNRGRAYGVFNTLYGAAMLISSVLMGFLYEWSVTCIIFYAVIMELGAIAVFIKFKGSFTKMRLG